MALRIPTLLDAILEATADKAGAEARIAGLRNALEDEARRRYDDEGAAPSWNAPKLGKVRFEPPGDPVPHVEDHAAFGAWVAEQYPTEVVQTLTVAPKHVGAARQALSFAGVEHDVAATIRQAWLREWVPTLEVDEDDDRIGDERPAVDPSYTVADPASGEVVPGIGAARPPGKLVVSLDRDRRTVALDGAKDEVTSTLRAAGVVEDTAALDARRRELEGFPAEVLSAYADRLNVGRSGTKAALAERIARTEARTGHAEELTTAASLADTSEPIEDSHETPEEAHAYARTAPSVAAIKALGSREVLRGYAKAHGIAPHGTKDELAIRLSASSATIDSLTRWVEEHNTTQEPT